MGNKRLLDAIERGFDIGRRVGVFAFPISDRSRMTSSCAGKIRLREPSKHAASPNLASRNNVTHGQTYMSILHTPPLVRRRNWEKGISLRLRSLDRAGNPHWWVRGVMVPAEKGRARCCPVS